MCFLKSVEYILVRAAPRLLCNTKSSWYSRVHYGARVQSAPGGLFWSPSFVIALARKRVDISALPTSPPLTWLTKAHKSVSNRNCPFKTPKRSTKKESYIPCVEKQFSLLVKAWESHL